MKAVQRRRGTLLEREIETGKIECSVLKLVHICFEIRSSFPCISLVLIK